jgi:phosphatidylglycerol---prolipoprotein diacylglyceryl transferase
VYPRLTIGPLPGSDASITVASYLVVRFVALAVAGWLAVRLCARQGIAARDALAVVLLGVPAGLLGAHLLALLEGGGYGALDAGLRYFWRSHSAIFGGLLGGVAVAAAYTRWRGLSLRRLLDACAPVMAFGEGMTRIGCFLAGCCYGRPTDSWLGITFPKESIVFVAEARAGLLPLRATERSLRVHPTQIYAAAFGFVLFVVLLRRLRRPRRFDGELFCLFLFCYGLWRFLLFYLRGDPGTVVIFGLYASQLWALVAVAAAMALERLWERSPERAATLAP